HRVYELIVEISSVSPESLGYCSISELATQMLRELTGEDVRATCTEMVASLAYTHQEQQEGIDQISNIIVELDSDPFSSFYLPGSVKFFRNLAVMTVLNKPVSITLSLDDDPTMTGVAVDTTGIRGSNVEGKHVLQKTGTCFEFLVTRIGHQAKNASTELKIRCLDAIPALLYPPPEQQTDDLLKMTESCFSSSSQDPQELFHAISNQLFPEPSLGPELMFSSLGLIEYVLDQSVEHVKASKDAKRFAKSKTTAEIFGNPNYLRLTTYLSEGPYYVKLTSTTAVEGAT
uniref:Uncharacterized protein n=1 Tax=Otolemur garnettii TaxID=30611 RepID=H0XJC9_OTOGA